MKADMELIDSYVGELGNISTSIQCWVMGTLIDQSRQRGDKGDQSDE